MEKSKRIAVDTISNRGRPGKEKREEGGSLRRGARSFDALRLLRMTGRGMRDRLPPSSASRGIDRRMPPPSGREASASDRPYEGGPHPALRATCPPCGTRKLLRAYAFPCSCRPLRKFRLHFFCHRQREAGIPRARGRLGGTGKEHEQPDFRSEERR